MKLVLIVGSGAVGKMTVGQSLMKITNLRLFHNHMMIEPVIEIFGKFNGKVVNQLRQTIFDEFVQSDNEGLIFTYMWAFDMPSDWDYINHLVALFEKHHSDIYCIELVAPQAVRIERNKTENRLNQKASKRNIVFSEGLIKKEDGNYRLESHDGEIPFKNYLKIDNSNLSSDEVAAIIKNTFNL